MKILENEDLSRYTTIRVGGTASTMLIPENTDELLSAILEGMPDFFIGGGSNMLINDRAFERVIHLGSFASAIENLGGGQFRVGASVRLQRLINVINESGYGGIEYLYSVPGLVGGAIVMNAGRGRSHNKSISDYLISVEAIQDGQRVTLTKDACGFGYRDSVFKHSPIIVVSALFGFPAVSQEESAQSKQDRLRLCQKQQDNSAPNFGSVFMECNPRIMAVVKRISLGSGRAHFSNKTSNWMLNSDGAGFADVMNPIRKVEKIHGLLGCKCSREVIIIK